MDTRRSRSYREEVCQLELIVNLVLYVSAQDKNRSRLIASDANAKEVQVEMGHSSVQVSFDLYGHLFPEDDGRRHQRSEQLASELFG